MDEVLQIPPSLLTCGGCQQNIGDRYFLKAIDQYWHEDCLSCDLCGCRLGEVGRRLYYKLGRKLCRRDYLRYPPRALGDIRSGYRAGQAVKDETQLPTQRRSRLSLLLRSPVRDTFLGDKILIFLKIRVNTKSE